jgi:hypothetical protein
MSYSDPGDETTYDDDWVLTSEPINPHPFCCSECKSMRGALEAIRHRFDSYSANDIHDNFHAAVADALLIVDAALKKNDEA